MKVLDKQKDDIQDEREKLHRQIEDVDAKLDKLNEAIAKANSSLKD